MRASFLVVAAGLLAEEPAHTLVIGDLQPIRDQQRKITNKGPTGPHRSQSKKEIAPATTPQPANTYAEVSATPVTKQGAGGGVVSEGRYLIASFPHLKQVAYCMLPDNVWRPLVMGDLTAPKGVAVDAVNNQLFVADPSEGKVYKYKLAKKDGRLQTDNQQLVALEGYAVKWMAVSGVGDLYFTGKAIVEAPRSSYDAVFRLDAALIAKGATMTAMEIYSRTNSGSPFPKVWMPSGVAVDSFHVYWGNQESGTQYGAINKGQRQNVGGRSTPDALVSLTAAQDDVRGMISTGITLYYLTPKGVFAVPSSQDHMGFVVTDEGANLIGSPPSGDLNENPFDPQSIAFDGMGTAYFTDYTTGAVYSLPANDLKKHNLTKFVDAPGVHGVSVFILDESSGGSRGMPTLLTGMLATLACAFGAFGL